MLRFRFVLIAAAFLAAAPLFIKAQTPAAATTPAAAPASVPTSEKPTKVPFRVGEIFSAEISRLEPQFEAVSPFDRPSVENPAWVELIVKIDKDRTISRFDYELVGKRKDPYPCFAVAEGNLPYSFDPEKWIIKETNQMRYYRMLFPVEQSELFGVSGLLTMSLKLKLYETKLLPTTFQVRLMPDGNGFTGVTIPAAGILNIPYSELKPEVQSISANARYNRRY